MAIKRDGRGTPILDLPFNACLGELPGLSIVPKFGRAKGIELLQETIWTNSIDNLYTFPESGQTMKVSSTNSADAAGVLGAVQKVAVTGLDGDYNPFIEVVSLDGLTGVELTNKVIRVNNMECLGDAPTAANTGEIWLGTGTITAGIPAVRYANMAKGANIISQAVFTVPVAHKGLLWAMDAAVSEGKSAEVSVYIRFGVGSGALLQETGTLDIFETTHNVSLPLPLCLPEKSDLEFRGKGAAAGTDMSIFFQLLLVSSAYESNINI